MIRVALPGLAQGTQYIGRDATHYLCRVLRLGPGDRFIAFDPIAKTEAEATILDATGVTARVEATGLRPAAVVAGSAVVLVYALAKGEKVDAVVRDATELGATCILVARTSRSISKADGDRAAGKLERWRRIAEQAARQCGRGDPPRIEGILSWHDALAAAAAEADARFCLWEQATEPLGSPLAEAVASGASIAFAVGPEGGLSAAEAEEARALGFAPTSLGRFVLRTETVPTAVLGAVRVLSRS